MSKEKEDYGKEVSRESEYSLLMSSLNVSVSKHLLDEHFTVIWANNRYYEMFGYTKEEYEAEYHNQCDLFYKDNPEDWKELVQYVSNTLGSGASQYEYVCRMRHRSGKKLWIKLVGNLTNEEINGTPVSYSVMMDITAQMQLQVEQTATYNNFPGFIAKYKVLEGEFRLIDANQRYFELFPKRESYRLENLTADNGLAGVAEYYERFRKGEPVDFTISPVSLTGKQVHMHVSAECVDWEDKAPVYLLIYSDITQFTEQKQLLERQNRELERLAFTDMVTGGMNRTRFNMVAQQSIGSKPAGTYVLVWLNMQKFKLINDLAGNEQGNETLKYVYREIAANLQPGEYLARISADNYALLLKNAADEAISLRLNEMVAQINRFNDGNKYKYVLTFTAGIYRIDDTSLDVTQIQDRAHVARRKIRQMEGSLCTCRLYSEQEREMLVAEKEIENRMRTALAEREFEVYLQPKLSLKESEVAGAEALVRWNDPQKGLIPPDSFIPVFEKNGFIVPMDLFVLEEVCVLLRKWMDSGAKPLPVSVNVSRVHFTKPGFLEDYAQICSKYNVPTSLIELEVTETIVFELPQEFMKIVQLIHDYGFTCSMDDFGSGYSSLNLLKDIEVDVLKLDRAFFQSERMDDSRGKDVVNSVIQLAKQLTMSTVAEGVETEWQRDFLKQADCDMIQGYVFARPLPVRQFEQLVFGGEIST